MPTDIQHILETILTTTVPLGLYMWDNRRRAKKEIEIKHRENTALLSEMITERRFFPAHEHLERSGPLTIDGLRRTDKKWTEF
jgi:hypothetical protein